jgi:predicted Zn-dependent protease
MLTRDRLKQITEQVLAASRADDAVVSVTDSWAAHLRFARNTPSTSGSYTDTAVTVTSTVGTRSGSVTVNQLDEATLTGAVRRSEELARLAPEDPEYVPPLGPQRYREVKGFFDVTVERGPELMARGAAACIGEARERKLIAAGFTETRAVASALASSRGLFAHHAETGAYIGQTARTADDTGSGWASQASRRADELDYGAVARTAAAKAVASAEPRELPPGSYVTILEPACVANLVSAMVGAMGARAADEGRSFFSAPGGGNRLGHALFRDDVHIFSDPDDPRAPGRPWGGDGLPQARRDWIKEGAVAGLMYDRFWAAKHDREPVPYPSNILMAGGAGSVDDLVRSTERGLLVTSLWYIRSLDPRALLYTGLTRDGVFLIENGRVTHPVKNFRWNETPIAMLENVEAMSAPVRVPPRPSRSPTVVVPALKVKAFNFSSISDAI